MQMKVGQWSKMQNWKVYGLELAGCFVLQKLLPYPLPLHV